MSPIPTKKITSAKPVKSEAEIAAEWAKRKERLIAAIQLSIQEKGFRDIQAKINAANPDLYREEHNRDLGPCLNLLDTDRESCTAADCRCRVDFVGMGLFSNLRKPKPVKEILAHELHRGVLWLFCRLESNRCAPEFRRQCEVHLDIVRAYHSRLLKDCKSAVIEDLWSGEQEKRVLCRMFKRLDETQELINQQLTQCQNTAEWAVLTNNAKELHKFHLKPNSKNAKPAPVIVNHREHYEVERVIGCSLNQGKLWYLVKWEGYDSHDNSWEPEAAMREGQSTTKAFFAEYGKPSWKNPIILSPEGEEHQKWLGALEELARKQKEQARAARDLAAAERKLRRARRAEQEENCTPVRGMSIMHLTSPSPVRKRIKLSEASEREEKQRPGPVADHPEEDLYEVERVIGAKLRGKSLHYLVKWAGWAHADCSWEPAAGVQKARTSIKLFIEECGKPTKINPKIITKEGVLAEAAMSTKSSVCEEEL